MDILSTNEFTLPPWSVRFVVRVANRPRLCVLFVECPTALCYTQVMEQHSDQDAFARFVHIVRHLRSPQGCPWDREQTLRSLAPHLIEEAFETTDAINSDDSAEISDELGDLFLLATMLSVVFEERHEQSLPELLNSAADKLVRRHPHVYGDSVAADASEVKQQWQEIKENVEGRTRDNSALAGVSKGLPPLERAFQLQKKARKSGFDWPDAASVLAKAKEELGELETALDGNALDGSGNTSDRDSADRGQVGGGTTDADGNSYAANEHVVEELGDLLFSVVNVARYLEIDPSLAMHRANEKFGSRFRKMERELAQHGVPLDHTNVDEMNRVWEKQKRGDSAGDQ